MPRLSREERSGLDINALDKKAYGARSGLSISVSDEDYVDPEVLQLREQIAQLESQMQIGGTGIAQIGQSNIKIDTTGVEISGDINEADFDAFVEQVAKLKTSYQWVVGDLAIYGQTRYGQSKYQSLAQILGEKETTVEDWAYVCRNVQKSERSDLLKMAHHRLVCGENIEWQRYYLAISAQNKLSSAQLEILIKQVKNGVPTEQALTLLLTSKQVKPTAFQKVESQSGVLRSEILTKVANAKKRDRAKWIYLAEEQLHAWLELVERLKQNYPSD